MTPNALLARLDETDRRLLALLEDLDEDQLRVPYERGINPPVWEAGHAAFFYEYFFLRRLYGTEPLMPDCDLMWDSFDIPHRERWREGVVPGRRETMAYYRRVLDETRARIAALDRLPPEHSYLAQYVIAHQCMHLESLIWCRQTLAYPPPSFAGRYQSAPGRGASPGPPPQRTGRNDTAIPGGDYFIGMGGASMEDWAEEFSFDNERPGFRRTVEPFAIARSLVSCGEFLEFVEDGGYERDGLWSFGGGCWKRESGARHPRYWEKKDGTWSVRRFNRREPLDPRCPALHLSFWEAEAWCRWAGRRLPSEWEWEAAARGHGPNRDWTAPPEDLAADLDARFLGTAPAEAHAGGAAPSGCLQMVGSAWEWTSSQYLPFDGFCTDMYAYMSTLQFGDHKTTRGGSGATSASLIRETYRQAYHPDRNDVFTGFRSCAL